MYLYRFGEITQLGKDEHFGIATRLFHRIKSLFISSNTVTIETAEKKRAIDSAHAFLDGLTKCQSDIQISFHEPNAKLLSFHKSCPEYGSFKVNDPNLKTTLNLMKHLEQTRTYARQILRRIYKEEFVQLLINGDYNTPSFESYETIPKQITKNEVDIVACLYAMFSVALAQSDPSYDKNVGEVF